MHAKPHENIAPQPVHKQSNDDPGLGKRRTPTGVPMTGADRTSEEMVYLQEEVPGSLTSKRRATDE